MMKWSKWLIVWALERACFLIDSTRIPFWRLGYSCQLAEFSADLEDRWHTGVWHGPVQHEDDDE